MAICFAKYIETQISKGAPGYGDVRAWTPYKKFSGWITHDEDFEVEDPEKDKSSGYTWAERSSNKDDASTSSREKKKDEKPKRWYYRHKEKSDDDESDYRTYHSDESDKENSSVLNRMGKLDLDGEDPRELRALKEGDIPKWDGNTSRREYFRCIDMWACATCLPPRYRALRLLQNLRGNAWTKMEHVDLLSLKKTDGIQIFKDLLEKSV